MKQLLWGALACSLVVHAAHAQPREISDQLTNLDHLLAVQRAVLERVNVDDDAVRGAEFGARGLADFDRDRDGVFYTPGTAWGLYDYHVAIVQYVHDGNDADEDGVPGFYELECERAGGPRLDPNSSETTPGTPDGGVDCDGDGLGNIVELNLGLNPLNPQDGAIDSDNDGVSDAQERIAGTRFTPLFEMVEAVEESADHISIAIVLDQHADEDEMVLGSFYINYDNQKLSYDSAALGQAAADARKDLFALDLGAQVRANMTSFNQIGVQSGDVVIIRFEKAANAIGPFEFTFDIEDTTISPASARAGLSYGSGHPNEPLMVGGE